MSSFESSPTPSKGEAPPPPQQVAEVLKRNLADLTSFVHKYVEKLPDTYTPEATFTPEQIQASTEVVAAINAFASFDISKIAGIPPEKRVWARDLEQGKKTLQYIVEDVQQRNPCICTKNDLARMQKGIVDIASHILYLAAPPRFDYKYEEKVLGRLDQIIAGAQVFFNNNPPADLTHTEDLNACIIHAEDFFERYGLTPEGQAPITGITTRRSERRRSGEHQLDPQYRIQEYLISHFDDSLKTLGTVLDTPPSTTVLPLGHRLYTDHQWHTVKVLEKSVELVQEFIYYRQALQLLDPTVKSERPISRRLVEQALSAERALSRASRELKKLSLHATVTHLDKRVRATPDESEPIVNIIQSLSDEIRTFWPKMDNLNTVYHKLTPSDITRLIVHAHLPSISLSLPMSDNVRDIIEHQAYLVSYMSRLLAELKRCAKQLDISNPKHVLIQSIRDIDAKLKKIKKEPLAIFQSGIRSDVEIAVINLQASKDDLVKKQSPKPTT